MEGSKKQPSIGDMYALLRSVESVLLEETQGKHLKRRECHFDLNYVRGFRRLLFIASPNILIELFSCPSSTTLDATSHLAGETTSDKAFEFTLELHSTLLGLPAHTNSSSVLPSSTFSRTYPVYGPPPHNLVIGCWSLFRLALSLFTVHC